MNDRNAKIITRVRAKLGELGTANIQNEDIYDNASIVIDDMLQDMKCVEKTFTLYLKEGKTEYLLENKNALLIKKIIPSWDGDLSFEEDWENAKYLTGSYPFAYNIFGNKFIIAPAPTNNSDTINIWAFQTSQINAMDDDFEPETPESIDNVLVLGICAEFNPEKFKLLYEEEKQRKKSLFHAKTTKKYSPNATW